MKYHNNNNYYLFFLMYIKTIPNTESAISIPSTSIITPIDTPIAAPTEKDADTNDN